METKNLLKSLKRRLSWMLCLVALLVTSQNVWAGAGFWSEDAFSATFNTSEIIKGNSTGVSTLALGSISSLELTSAWSKAWKDGSGNICGGLMEYKIDDGSTQEILNPSINWEVIQFSYGKTSITIPADGASHTLKFRFKCWGSTSNNWECNNNMYLENGGGWYQVTFTSPGPTLYLRGDVISWEATDATKMSESSGTYTKTVNSLREGEYNIKVAGADWGSSDNYGYDNGEISRSSSSLTLQYNKGNVNFIADKDGDYTFTFVYSSKELTVTYPTCTATKPTVTTAEADDVTEDSATLGGNVTDAGISTSCSAQTVSERGIEWTNSSGTPSGTKVKAAAGGTGTFTVSAKSLTGGTTYYYKAYATNATGTSYGDMESFTTETPCTPPTIDSTTPGSRCGAGTVTIVATASAGVVKWYDAATSGTLLNSGDSFTTPSISETKTYYAEADDNGCISTSRTSVTATVNSIPTITANGNSRCGEGDVTLTATPSSGASVDWYDSSTGDNKVAENTTSLTVQGVTVGSPVTRYAEAVKNGCKSSSRDQAVATAKLIPAVSNIALTGSGECGTGDVTFTATATENSTITWYDGGSSKGTDNPITISIAGGSSKTLTAKATLDGCEESTGMSEEGSRKPAPNVSASTTNTTAYEVITLTSTSGSVTWSKSDAAAYFVKDQKAVDGNTVEAAEVNFKAPAKVGAYTVGATSNGCTSNLSITISTPTEVCN